jgi:hypothetical protein
MTSLSHRFRTPVKDLYLVYHLGDRNKSTITHDGMMAVKRRKSHYDDRHQVPTRSARPPLSATRAIAPRTLSIHEDRPVIPSLPEGCDDG